MFTFLLKRGFTNDVSFVLGGCFEQAAFSTRVFEGIDLNTRKPYLLRIERWLVHESSKLDTEDHLDAAAIGLAVHRARVWVGVHLAKAAYNHGTLDIPKRIIKTFWKPALYVSDHYFANLRDGIPHPFLRSMQDHFNDALEGARS